MIGTDPAHLPNPHRQNCRFILHKSQLTGRNPKHMAPPSEIVGPIPYKPETKEYKDAAIQQNALNPRAVSPFFSTKNTAPEWTRLIAVCIEAQANLEASWSDLEKNVVKAYLFKADKVTIQRHIEAGLHQVKIIYKITQALCEKDTAENKRHLQNALKELESIKLAATPQPIQHPQTRAKHGAITCFLKELHGFLAPVALMGWGLIAQSGLVSLITVQQMALISGVISIFWTIATSFKNRAEQASTEDQLKLIQVCNSLMENCMNIGRLENLPLHRETVNVDRHGNFSEFVVVARNMEAEVNALKEHAGRVTENGNNITQKVSVLERELNQKINNLVEDMTEVRANLEIILTLLQNKAQ